MGHRILIVGDMIWDQYWKGPVDTANEGGLRVATESLTYRASEGGAGFVRNSVASFSGSPSDLIRTSETVIVRYQDSSTHQTLLTIDYDSEPIDEWDKCCNHTHDAVVYWDDGRSPEETWWSTALLTLRLDGLVIVDSKDIKRWDLKSVDYLKMTIGDWDGTYPKHIKLILTGELQVNIIYPDSTRITYTVNTVKDPLDTIGAGDVFTSVFVTLLLEGLSEEQATREAIYYASQSVMHEGCYMPSRDHERVLTVRNL